MSLYKPQCEVRLVIYTCRLKMMVLICGTITHICLTLRNYNKIEPSQLKCQARQFLPFLLPAPSRRGHIRSNWAKEKQSATVTSFPVLFPVSAAKRDEKNPFNGQFPLCKFCKPRQSISNFFLLRKLQLWWWEKGREGCYGASCGVGGIATDWDLMLYHFCM